MQQQFFVEISVTLLPTFNAKFVSNTGTQLIFVSIVLIHPIKLKNHLSYMTLQHINHCSLLLISLPNLPNPTPGSIQPICLLNIHSNQDIPSAMIANCSAQENNNSNWLPD